MTTPLQGAGFELHDSSGTTVLSGTSDVNGKVDLGAVKPGSYTLVETTVPDGFVGGGPYTVVVSDAGEITIDSTPLASFTAENNPYPNVTFKKTDGGSGALPGAVFQLDDGNGTVLTATSTIGGDVIFYTVPPGSYTLTETQAPSGYVTDTTPHSVEVADNGDVTIDGNSADEFSFANQAGYAFSFTKVDATQQSTPPVIDPVSSGLSPVTGTGVSGSTITVTWPDNTTTDADVDYNNTWTATPPATLNVGDTISAVQKTPGKTASETVSETAQQPSAEPTIDAVHEGDTQVTGTGVDGSTITVTWPGGAADTATVESDNTWTAAPPATLVSGDEISAIQKTGTAPPSQAASTTVLAAFSASPAINTIADGGTDISGTGVAGSTINITWPSGFTPPTGSTTVESDSTWTATASAALAAGQVVNATQTEVDKVESQPATSTVTSALPTINPVKVGDGTIAGTGVADSTINITWPDQSTGTAPVDTNGDWSTPVPGTPPLAADDPISVTQTTLTYPESPKVEVTVTA